MALAMTDLLRFRPVGDDARMIAVRVTEGALPAVLWCGGFKSDMRGTKAEALAAWGEAHGRRIVRFDYSGHGESGGDFTEGTITRWLEETVAVFDAQCHGQTLVIGSSMGGWIALLLARLRKLHGLLLIAPAPDFTEKLRWASFSDAVRRQIMETGQWLRPSPYDGGGYPITRGLIEDGRNHLLMDAPVVTGCPVHILQGKQDADVPWQHAMALLECLSADNVDMTLVPDGDHRLSRPQDIDLMLDIVAQMTGSEAEQQRLL
jgi:pimeloyl-ACP methyl ester carboxylesterase